MSQKLFESRNPKPQFSMFDVWSKAVVIASLLLVSRPVLAELGPVVLVPVVTDPADEPRLVELAKVLRALLADRNLPSVAARYTATLEDAQNSGDSFAAALDLSGEFTTLHYDLYSDELVRAHALRLLGLAKAHIAIVLAAPTANRIVLKKISKDDGQSITLPDPCDSNVAKSALADLLALEPSPSLAPEPSEARKTPHVSKWFARGAAVLGAGAATVAVSLAARRHTLGTRFQGTGASDAGYLSRGDDWRSRRAPMLAAASVAAASLSLGAVLFALEYDETKLVWLSVPAAAIGTAALAWAATDLAHGATCGADGDASCVRAESQLDRGILLALLATPPIALATTHLSRWFHNRIRFRVDAAPRLASLVATYRY
jgi:hypothetical protein